MKIRRYYKKIKDKVVFQNLDIRLELKSLFFNKHMETVAF